MPTISNTPRPGYAYDSAGDVWYPIGTGPHTHADYITSGSAINPNIVDAKGDIIAATAADTVARLAVGANDTVLTADSSTATGLKWATVASGGMTLISTTTLSGASVTLSSIPQTYTNLQLIIAGVTANTGNNTIRVRPNNAGGAYAIGNESTAINEYANDSIFIHGNAISTLRTDANNVMLLNIFNYTSTTQFKPIQHCAYIIGSDSGYYVSNHGGAWTSTNAITSLVINYGGTNTFAGGTALLYGVK